MKPRFQHKELDQEDCKWVLTKVQEKVLKNTTAELEAAQGGFLTGKREKKVADLVDSYAEKRRQEVAKQKKAAPAAAATTAKLAPVAPLAAATAPARAMPVLAAQAAAAAPKPPHRSRWDQ